jgi:hypothetical protein
MAAAPEVPGFMGFGAHPASRLAEARADERWRKSRRVMAMLLRLILTECELLCTTSALVARYARIDTPRPEIDASGERLRVVKPLAAQPHSNRERTRTVMAEDDDGLIRVEFCVGPAGNVAHGDEGCARDGRGCELPGFAYVQQEGCFGLSGGFVAYLEVLLRRNLRRECSFGHDSRINPEKMLL